MARTSPAWRRLVEEGWFDSRNEAERWILSGKVRAGNQVITSAGQLIKEEDALHVRGINDRYLSKGGLKLEAALNGFSIEVPGRVCIDAGASTGGFTDCLVQHGAELVYAVDVGYGQLAGSLRLHPHVINLERTNIGDPSLHTLDPRPTLGTVDLSYLSLRKGVPEFARVMHRQGELVCLVKPLFETDDAAARRTGILSESDYAPLLHSLMDDLISDGYAVHGILHSPVTGNQGTLEFLLHLLLDGPDGLSPPQRRQAVASAVDAALALPPYHKKGDQV